MNRKPFAVFFLLALVAIFAFQSLHKRLPSNRSIGSLPVGTVYVIVDKSDYELHVYDDLGWYATYPVVFGSKSQGDKMMAGDRRTPEGHFLIVTKKPHHKWHKMLLIDYPNKESWEKFRRRKAEGLIPPSAKIGGGIGIHGTWPDDDLVVDDYTNWTEGCVSMRNADLDELCEYVQPGMKVIIRK